MCITWDKELIASGSKDGQNSSNLVEHPDSVYRKAETLIDVN